jgi:hypothetical protein
MKTSDALRLAVQRYGITPNDLIFSVVHAGRIGAATATMMVGTFLDGGPCPVPVGLAIFTILAAAGVAEEP